MNSCHLKDGDIHELAIPLLLPQLLSVQVGGRLC